MVSDYDVVLEKARRAGERDAGARELEGGRSGGAGRVMKKG